MHAEREKLQSGCHNGMHSSTCSIAFFDESASINQGRSALGSGVGDGWRVVVGGNDDVVEVGL